MKMKDLTKYEGHFCRVKFSIKSKRTFIGQDQERTGYVRCVSTKLLILYIDDEEGRDEIDVPLVDIKSCDYLE